ncbi:MAG: type III-B CRISPR module RAMP protein Cmr6 [Planktothrix agardhii KL2]|uniref:RAMP superfamily CRISPR-associated protein n=2 Tax=Planktothrix agardhii TaxID=1160 RepID=UPI001A238663|nr:RAMP superfamily CRISPR-associated protein [Planktothrix agardhii]MBG0746855.1 type III-B CRISPR module RAMP protein Cmr6 [Planktothrix agardhii KL2]
MAFDRPTRPTRPGEQPPATSRPNQAVQRNTSRSTSLNPNRSSGGDGGRRDGGGGGSNRPNQPSPWLDNENEPLPDKTASFVEYLRWMRSPDTEHKDATKVQILQMAEENANYQQRLQQLTDRTKLIAGEGNSFQVKCPWRIRVGGHRGPESILLPAFDALGMPYIPSSSLRGVARNQAIREIMSKEKVDWKEAEKRVAPWFGSLEEKGENRSGKVVFLDAYPLPNQDGLMVDMANNIWKWEGNDLKYNPNPNPFLSLKEPMFLIGLRLASGCTDIEVLNQVKKWLVKGLQAGIGSQVNTGYGELMKAGEGRPKEEFFSLEFTLQGQLIHGRQKFTQWNWNDNRQNWQHRGQAEAEVRPVAFKSMLRYWFRSLALGVLPVGEVPVWENKLFGGINNPQREWGWIRVEILEGKVTQKEPKPNYQGKDDPCGEQEGTLTFSYALGCPTETKTRQAIANLMKNLTWLMFHLGGIGQGARRPCYSRQNRQYAPWWRGSTLIPNDDNSFWNLPNNVKEFQQKFQIHLRHFYQALSQLPNIPNIRAVNNPINLGQVHQDNWKEAIDSNCQIVVCSGEEDFGKPYALAVLHGSQLKINNNYDGNLCGRVSRGVKPSPVWIADLEDYQVVTIFGATENPRKSYLEKLKQNTLKDNFAQIWPLN